MLGSESGGLEPSPDFGCVHTEELAGVGLHKLSIIVLATCLLTATPSVALPALEDFELKLRGEAQGWLNATCTYYGLGWLDSDQGRQALSRLMLLITGHQIGNVDPKDLKAAALARDPGCVEIWPKPQK